MASRFEDMGQRGIESEADRYLASHMASLAELLKWGEGAKKSFLVQCYLKRYPNQPLEEILKGIRSTEVIEIVVRHRFQIALSSESSVPLALATMEKSITRDDVDMALARAYADQFHIQPGVFPEHFFECSEKFRGLVMKVVDQTIHNSEGSGPEFLGDDQ